MEDIASYDLISLSVDGEEFLLNVFRSQPHILELTLTNGTKVWKGTAGADNKPNNRRYESDEYFGLLLKYLQSRCDNVEYCLDLQPNIVYLTLKEALEVNINNAKAIFMKTTLEEVDNAPRSILDLLRRASEVLQLKNASVQSLHDVISSYESTIQSLNTEIFKFNEDKKSFQDNLLRNMTLLLNTKKEEVASLRSALTATESQNNNNFDTTVTETTVAPKTKLKRGRKPKGTESLATPMTNNSTQVTTQATTLSTQDNNMSQLLQPVGYEVASGDLQRHLSQESADPPSLKRRRSDATDTQESLATQTNERPKRAASMRRKNNFGIDSDEDCGLNYI